MSCSTRASSMTIATSTSSWSMPRRSRRHPHPDHRLQPGPGDGRAARAAHALVPQRLVAWIAGTSTGRCSSRSTGRRARAPSRPSHPTLGGYYLYCEGDVPLLFTENETNNERLFGDAEREPLRQGRHQQLRGARAAGGGESGRRRAPRSAAHYRLTVAPARTR